MSEVSASSVRDLRERTGAGMMDCKKALAEVHGDIEKAIVYLREKGLAAAAKRAGRTAADGLVEAYIHAGGKIGVLIEVNCETDFVARTDDFRGLVRDLAMQVAAANPRYVSREDVPVEVVEQERAIYAAQAATSGTPPASSPPTSTTTTNSASWSRSTARPTSSPAATPSASS